MPTPTRSDIHIDTLATNFSIAYKNRTFIARDILPDVRVQKQTGKYAIFEKSSWFRDEAHVRAPAATAPLAYWKMDTAGTYTCLEWAQATLLADEIIENADNPINPLRTSTDWVMYKIRLAQEVRVASLLFSTTTFSGYTYAATTTTIGTTGIQWDTYETSDPIQDVNAMRYQIISNCGFAPNKLVVGVEVDKALRVHPAVLERVKYSQLGIVTNQLLAQLFDVDQYLVGMARYTTSEEGTTASYSNVWGDYALLAYVPGAPALETPAMGYTVTWKQPQVNRYRKDENHAWLLEAIENVDEIVTAAAAGFLLSDVLT